jgi:hypothetical protein
MGFFDYIFGRKNKNKKTDYVKKEVKSKRKTNKSSKCKGMVYLVQPPELVRTHRYKVGCSKRENLTRLNSYGKKGTRVIKVESCDDPHKLEKVILDVFCEHFKLIDGTREYFIGDENLMKKKFAEVVRS